MGSPVRARDDIGFIAACFTIVPRSLFDSRSGGGSSVPALGRGVREIVVLTAAAAVGSTNSDCVFLRRSGDRAGPRGKASWQKMCDEFLGPHSYELRPGGEQLLFGMHPPCDADCANSGTDRMPDIADCVGDERKLVRIRSFRMMAFSIGGGAISVDEVRPVGQKTPDAGSLVLFDVAAEDV